MRTTVEQDFVKYLSKQTGKTPIEVEKILKGYIPHVPIIKPASAPPPPPPPFVPPPTYLYGRR
jgi:hypothetical protein